MKIVVAGASGYLGQYMVKTLGEAGHEVIALVRSKKKIEHLASLIYEIVQVDISDKRALKGLFQEVDAVFSSVGITRQKDGLTYMDVDYQCNRNLLDGAIASGVKKFMYIAALRGNEFTELKIMQAKEKFVDELTSAPIDAYVIRPSGFFSDVEEMYHMAKAGKVYVVGKGDYRANPIHGEDLAFYCMETFSEDPGTYNVGGPDMLSQVEIAKMAFHSLKKKAIIKHIPVWLVKMTKRLLVIFTKQTFYGPIEFFMTVLTVDMEGPKVGKRHLKEYFDSLS